MAILVKAYKSEVMSAEQTTEIIFLLTSTMYNGR